MFIWKNLERKPSPTTAMDSSVTGCSGTGIGQNFSKSLVKQYPHFSLWHGHPELFVAIKRVIYIAWIPRSCCLPEHLSEHGCCYTSPAFPSVSIPSIPSQREKSVMQHSFGDSLLRSTLYPGFHRRISHVQVGLSVETPLGR